jgi:hypothetical protein
LTLKHRDKSITQEKGVSKGEKSIWIDVSNKTEGRTSTRTSTITRTTEVPLHDLRKRDRTLPKNASSKKIDALNIAMLKIIEALKFQKA